MRIVPKASLGEMDEIKIVHAATISWKWYYSAVDMIIWLILILALAIPKSNRNVNALLIFIPMLVLYPVWLVLVKLTSMPSSAQESISPLYQSMVIGLAVLWLTAEHVKIFRPRAIFIISMLTIAIVLSIGIISSTGGLNTVGLIYTLMFLALTFGLFVAMAITRRICRKKYGPVRFMLWLVLWTVVVSNLGIVILYTVYILSQSIPSDMILTALLQMTLVGLVCGFIIYVMNLPFMILGFLNPFFRERFYSVMRLNPTPQDGSR